MKIRNLWRIYFWIFRKSRTSFEIQEIYGQKQPSTCVLLKRWSEIMQQIYSRTSMLKCDFNRVAKQLYWNHTSAWVFSCKFAVFLRTLFSKNTYGGLLLYRWKLHCIKLLVDVDHSVNKPKVVVDIYSYIFFFFV